MMENTKKGIRLPKGCPALSIEQLRCVLNGRSEPDRSLCRSSWQSIGFFRKPSYKVSGWHDYNA